MATEVVPQGSRSGIAIPVAGLGLHTPHSSRVQDRESMGNFNAVTGWTALNTDTANLAVAPEHILGTQSIEFDKADTAANTTVAGCYVTISPAVDVRRFTALDKLQSAVFIADKTNVAYAFIELGTDASHYNEWRLDDSAITQNVWQSFSVLLNTAQATGGGNGWTPSAIAFIFVGVVFDAEANTLAGIRFDHCQIVAA